MDFCNVKTVKGTSHLSSTNKSLSCTVTSDCIGYRHLSIFVQLLIEYL